MTNEMVVIDQNMLMCVAGGDGDYQWEDIGFSGNFISGNLGMVADGFSDFGSMLNDFGSDLGIWAYDFFNS
jgi:hypothetical protein